MKRMLFVLIMLTVFFCGGCGQKGVAKRDIYQTKTKHADIKIKLPAGNNTPVLIESETTFNNKQYFKVGDIAILNLKKACFRGDCKSYKINTDNISELLAMAKSHGGTHFVLNSNKPISKGKVEKDSDICNSIRGGDQGTYATHRNADGSYNPFGGVSKPIKKGYCEQWSKISGEGEWVETGGTIWVKNPDIAKKANRIKDINKLIPAKSPKTGQCGYQEPVLNSFVIRPIYDKCMPFFKIDKTSELPDHAYTMKYNSWNIIDRKGNTIYRDSLNPGCSSNNPNCFRKAISLEMRSRGLIN